MPQVFGQAAGEAAEAGTGGSAAAEGRAVPGEQFDLVAEVGTGLDVAALWAAVTDQTGATKD